jgi:adenylate kinase
MEHIQTILFVGKPGSGKETQARLLAEETGFKVFSTGDRFREIRKEDTNLGTRVRETLDQGRLLPHWLASYLFQEAILHVPLSQGLIFEGTGRALSEAELFDEVALWLGRSYRVINLTISDDEAVKRQIGRGRADSDTEEKVRVRLAEYEKHTAPVIDFFKKKGVLIDIDGKRPIDEIQKEIRDIFNAE